MAVDGFHTVIVANHYVVAVALTLVFAEANFAVESYAYSIAYFEGEVNAFVYSAESGTVAVVGGDVAGDGGNV